MEEIDLEIDLTELEEDDILDSELQEDYDLLSILENEDYEYTGDEKEILNTLFETETREYLINYVA
jgi:hypothetical protein